MIISHSKKVILIRPAKVGGTSVESALAGALVGPGDYYGTAHDLHACLERIRQMVSPEVWASYLKVSLVRNPWDWFVSAVHAWFTSRFGYRAARAEYLHPCGNVVVAEPSSRVAVKCAACRRPRRLSACQRIPWPTPAEAKAWMAENTDRMVRLFCQPWSVCGETVNRYYGQYTSPPEHWDLEGYHFDATGAQVPDVVLRFEHLESDFDALCSRLGLSLKLSRENEYDYRDRPFMGYYTSQETIEAVRAKFPRLIERYGYMA